MKRLETRISVGLFTLVLLILVVSAASIAGQDDDVEGTSLLGRPLIRPDLPEDFRTVQTGHLQAAREALSKAPANP